MASKTDITPELLRQLLRYEPETGKLFWRARSLEFFKGSASYPAERSCKIWNTRFANKEAFFTLKDERRKCGILYGKHYYAHRVVFAVVHGHWPNGHIDHIDGDPSNNRIKNLRDVTNAENSKNQKRNRRNKSGVSGVYLDEKWNRWRVRIKISWKTIHLGSYATFEDAVKARKDAEALYGFHPNHGREPLHIRGSGKAMA